MGTLKMVRKIWRQKKWRENFGAKKLSDLKPKYLIVSYLIKVDIITLEQ
jgi:hypothetical protein